MWLAYALMGLMLVATIVITFPTLWVRKLHAVLDRLAESIKD